MRAKKTKLTMDTGFNSRLWLLALFGLVGGLVAPRLSLKENQAGTGSGDNSGKPYLTELLEAWSTPSEQTRESNQEHLDLSIKKAESQLMIQDAQKPAAHRIRFLPYVSSRVFASLY